jgi:hypothetical protein
MHAAPNVAHLVGRCVCGLPTSSVGGGGIPDGNAGLRFVIAFVIVAFFARLSSARPPPLITLTDRATGVMVSWMSQLISMCRRLGLSI